MSASLTWCPGVTPGGGGYQSPLFTPESRFKMSEFVPENEDVEVPFEEMEGHEVFVQPSMIRPSEAARLALFADKSEENEAAAVVDLLDMIETKYVIDSDGYQRVFVEKGLEGIISLVMAWLGELVASKH